MTATGKGSKDRRVLTLAAEVAETKDRNVPILLLDLQEIVDSVPVGSKEATRIKNEIWTYDLLQVLILVLKQDFDRVRGGWGTATKLANLLSHCCTGLDPPDSQEFYQLSLPEAVENQLMLSRKIQTKYLKTDENMTNMRRDLLDHFRGVLEAVTYLFSGHVFLTTNVLKSQWLLQLLITDDVDTALSCMTLILNCTRVNRDVFSTLSERLVNSILDELVYKLSASTNMDIGSATTRILLTICDTNPPMVEQICIRYRGLRPLLSKWTGKGFGKDLKQLILLLESGSAHRAKMERLHRAATTIQAMWRSFQTRNQLKKADRAFAKLQRSFRVKRERTQKERENEQLQSELEHQLLLARRKAIRESRLKQLELLSIMPAAKSQKYLESVQENAALKIQTSWKGHRARKQLTERQANMKRVRAAVAIQRKFRHWSARRERKKREPLAFQRPPGLTDERRVEIQQHITRWREDHPTKCKTRAQQEEIHNKAQELIQRNQMLNRVTRKKHLEREALLAMIETDCDLLLNATSLKDVTEKDIDVFSSKSVPIATKARLNHQHELRLLRQPWYRKLGDEFKETEYEGEEELF
ncbi:IQ calmodulin-binding motif-containing protein 1 [Lingula anatina]|uniref:IQ calmodulin-binding motif-containing protein 1 n=1 Tax=Lingula anatina TaxID=7574 RepID=A0A1S3JUD9_LINAN|nr:IQ calmodulin-binding motif-containing protein 1 [Lingula anatina]|eukprot:XP_013413711.1 IQ calmodulin-binding motif-containing protein 1 [Lingula anatina]